MTVLAAVFQTLKDFSYSAPPLPCCSRRNGHLSAWHRSLLEPRNVRPAGVVPDSCTTLTRCSAQADALLRCGFAGLPLAVVGGVGLAAAGTAAPVFGVAGVSAVRGQNGWQPATQDERADGSFLGGEAAPHSPGVSFGHRFLETWPAHRAGVADEFAAEGVVGLVGEPVELWLSCACGKAAPSRRCRFRSMRGCSG